MEYVHRQLHKKINNTTYFGEAAPIRSGATISEFQSIGWISANAGVHALKGQYWWREESSHCLTLDKLQLYDLPEPIIRWMEAFLLDKSQILKMGKHPVHINTWTTVGLLYFKCVR